MEAKSKTNLLILLVLILFISQIITLIYFGVFKKDHEKGFLSNNSVPSQTRKPYTREIPYPDAKALWQGYVNAPANYLYGWDKTNSKAFRLDGFAIEKDVIKPLLIDTVEYIHIRFGMEKINSQNFFKILILAADKKNNLIMKTTSEPYIFEFCDPCPGTCPNGITTYFPK